MSALKLASGSSDAHGPVKGSSVMVVVSAEPSGGHMDAILPDERAAAPSRLLLLHSARDPELEATGADPDDDLTPVGPKQPDPRAGPQRVPALGDSARTRGRQVDGGGGVGRDGDIEGEVVVGCGRAAPGHVDGAPPR